MEWNRSETIALARPKCAYCLGIGIRRGRRKGYEHACECVFRAIFKTCYVRFRECVTMEKHLSTVSLDWSSGPRGKRFYGRKVEEYVADFCAVSRRTLDDQQYPLFRYHYLLGADWKLCCRVLKIEKGDFFHRVYRIEEILGRTFRELKPYALFPLYEYFGTSADASFHAASSGARRPSSEKWFKSQQLLKIA
jgi:hypothetical protein